MALNLVPSPLRNFSVILRDINYVGLQESFRMRWPLASSRLCHSVTLTHKASEARQALAAVARTRLTTQKQ